MKDLSNTITELNNIFKALNEQYFDGILDTPIITVQSMAKKRSVLGWCSTKKIWIDKDGTHEAYEINIAGEHLGHSLIDIATVIQHEAVHLFCVENEIQDTSRGGYYHNKKYKEQAEARGLVINSEDKKNGWNNTEPTEDFVEFISTFGFDEEAFSIYRNGDLEVKEEKEKKPKKPKIIWQCPNCKTEIKSKKEDLNCICGDCNQKFEMQIIEDEFGGMENEEQD